MAETDRLTGTELLRQIKEDKNYRDLPVEDRERLDKQLADNVINPILLARYVGVQPQMVYQYIRDGKLPLTKANNTQKLFIPEASAFAWAAMYLNRKRLRLQQQALVADLDAEVG